MKIKAILTGMFTSLFMVLSSIPISNIKIEPIIANAKSLMVVENGVTEDGFEFKIYGTYVEDENGDTTDNKIYEYAEISKYTGNDTVVDIPDTILGCTVKQIGNHAFAEASNIVSINIPDSITTIGSGAFESMDALLYITIPDSIQSINSETFSGCINLISCTLPKNLQVINMNAFCNCSSLTGIEIPDSVKIIKTSAFERCTNLTKVKISDSVESIGEAAFEDCTNITNVEIPNSVKTIGKAAFAGCDKLKSVVIPSSVILIETNAFGYTHRSVLWDNYYDKIEKFKIYSTKGSIAEKYALENGFTFIDLENILGDCNDDGKFNISDVVVFQKWLLKGANNELKKWQNADLNNDNMLDSFDLLLMKKELING